MKALPSIALVTVDAARELDQDLPPLHAALARAGAKVQLVSWDDPRADWSRYQLALLRSTWDYVDRLPAFLAWCERAEHLTRLRNPASIVRWNSDKQYLRDLAAAGVAIIPSVFTRVGEAVNLPPPGEIVVKPSVGAGSRGARRFAAHEREAALAHARSLLAEGRTVLAQPYLGSVDELGETALIFFAGEFSHAIRKGPLLQRGGSEVQGLFARENISPRVPTRDELAVARSAVAAIPGDAPLYARVDLIRSDSGAPQVLELELTEPSLFFDHAPGSADRYAEVILRSLAAGVTPRG
jgi:O-ureido-D-serine cyclo-ligase